MLFHDIKKYVLPQIPLTKRTLLFMDLHNSTMLTYTPLYINQPQQ